MENTPRQPHDPAEIARRVETIWTEVLDAPADSGSTTFFELGGQSISAVRITARIEDEIGVRIDMGDLFEDPDLATFQQQVLAKLSRPGTELASYNVD